jgi:hypothetical protein
MKAIRLLLCTSALAAAEAPNPIIDIDRFSTLTREVAVLRDTRRVSEDEFLRLAAEPGTVILDARSREKYEQLHVKGSVHLNFADFTEASLAAVIPTKATRVLIYCNNNFEGAPSPFPSKVIALNLPTYVTLHGHGYTNVHELGPLLDVKTTRIPFAGTAAK